MFVKEITVMNFENYFPLWNDLNIAQKKRNYTLPSVRYGYVSFICLMYHAIHSI